MKEDKTKKIEDMKARIKELEKEASEKQINIDYLEKMIDLAKEYYNIDINTTPEK